MGAETMVTTNDVMSLNILVLLLSFFIPFCLFPLWIQWLKKKNIRSKGHVDHIIDGNTKEIKEKTPSFGGIVFILVPFLVVPPFLGTISRTYMEFSLLALILGVVGFLDDLFKITKTSKGISARAKSLGQVAASVVFLSLAIKSGALDSFHVPFLGKIVFTQSWGMLLGFGFFLTFIMVGTSNAVNLTDGMDGLASSLSLITLFFMTVMGWNFKEPTLHYLMLALIGSLLAFFLFNKKPAQIFMGDVGSLPLGGLIAGFAVYLHQELLLIFFGGMFVVETLSVMLQVFYFKRTKKRIFACAPLHHHYQFKGQSEQYIVKKFAGIQIAFGFVGMMIHLLAKYYV
ncbi:MAG: phospho-N-acetylmuramoyl-pentapeptide-transferase [Chlamydiae bacterium]|nr:phospho-N-acetylmuramoyl-pentapeptide-transferase [Chlamydiota bacterium]